MPVGSLWPYTGDVTPETENTPVPIPSRRGGARPGAGRKPKLKYEARELFNAAVDEHWDAIVTKLDESARAGDKDAIKMVIEHRIGRAPQSIEVNNQQTRVNFNMFFNPRVQETVKIFEDKIKQELVADIQNEYTPSMQ